jgi:hypothetical protein
MRFACLRDGNSPDNIKGNDDISPIQTHMVSDGGRLAPMAACLVYR